MKPDFNPCPVPNQLTACIFSLCSCYGHASEQCVEARDDPLWCPMCTGAWAHAASALREDLPASPKDQGAPPTMVPGQAPTQEQAMSQGAPVAPGFPAAPPQPAEPRLAGLAAPLPHPALPPPADQQLRTLQPQQQQQQQHGPAALQWQRELATSLETTLQHGHPPPQGTPVTGPAQSAGLALQVNLPSQLPAPTSLALSAGDPSAVHPPLSGYLTAAVSSLAGQPAALAVEPPDGHPDSVSAPGLA